MIVQVTITLFSSHEPTHKGTNTTRFCPNKLLGQVYKGFVYETICTNVLYICAELCLQHEIKEIKAKYPGNHNL